MVTLLSYGQSFPSCAPPVKPFGTGSVLVRSGLEQCRRSAIDAVFVLGHPPYYPRFGFQPSARFGIRSDYDVPEEVFMVIELRPGSLAGVNGIARYDDAFKDL